MKRLQILLGMVVPIIGLISCSPNEEEDGYKDSAEWQSLSQLDWGTGHDTTFVVGHLTPDCDAVFSAMSYAQLMKQLGFACEARVAGAMNNETKYACDLFGITAPEEIHEMTGKRAIMVDHSEYAQSVSGMKQARVLQIIDHHDKGDATLTPAVYTRIAPIGATCTLVYAAYQDLRQSITDDMARVMLAGIVSDTRFLTKPVTSAQDSLACYALMQQLNLSADSVFVLNKQMDDISHDYYGMTDTEIFLCDYKNYTIGDIPLGIASLDVYGEENALPFLQRMLDVMPEVQQAESTEMLFGKVDLHVVNTDPATCAVYEYLDAGSYILYHGKGAKEIAEQCYGESIAPGICFSNTKLSRKTDLVPAITKAILETKSRN